MPGTEMGILGVRGALDLLGKHVRQLDEGCVLRFTDTKGVRVSIPVWDPKAAATLLGRAQDAGAEGRLFPHVSRATLRAHMISSD
jgi:hypothetical protein